MTSTAFAMAPDLKPLLDTYSSAALNTIATFHGVLPKGSKAKAQVIAILAKTLTDPQHIRATLDNLSSVERGALHAIQRREEEVSLHSLRVELSRQGLIEKAARPNPDPYRIEAPNPRAVNSRRLEDVLARLTLRGLVFAAGDPPNPYPHNPNYVPPKRGLDIAPATVFIPDAIRRHLPPPPPRPEPPARRAVREPGTIAESSARSFQRDLYLYWSYVRDRSPSLTNKDELHKRALVELNATLLQRETLDKGAGENDRPRLRFLRGLLGGLGLLRVGSDRNLHVTGDADFFAHPPGERVRRSFEAWRDGDFFNELLLLPRELRPSGPGLIPVHRIIADARRAVLKHLRALRPAGWVEFDRLTERIGEADYEFLFHRPPARPAYYYGPTHPYSGANPLGLFFPAVVGDEDGWPKVEGNFIRGLVAGPLHWMGLIELGWTAGVESAPPSAFRLTPIGAWLFELGPQPEIAAEGGRVIVQPNLNIVALDPVNDATLVALDGFAERLSAERAVEYRLTRASVYAGQQAGWGVARIKQFLQEVTGAELPANVARTLDEWQAQHERIVIRPHVALAHGAPAALDDLMADPDSAGFVAARPLPEVALLQDARAVPGLAQALRGREILPLVTTRPSVPPASVEADEDGRLRFAVRAPSLYLHGHLAAFADPVEGGYRVTAQTVARAAVGGLTAEAIVERLAAVHRGPLPEALVRRIRAWAKHYGDAALEELTLLQVQDAATLDELLADPDVGPLLKRFSPSPQPALARVRRADLERLRALLAERGMDIGDKLQ